MQNKHEKNPVTHQHHDMINCTNRSKSLYVHFLPPYILNPFDEKKKSWKELRKNHLLCSFFRNPKESFILFSLVRFTNLVPTLHNTPCSQYYNTFSNFCDPTLLLLIVFSYFLLLIAYVLKKDRFYGKTKILPCQSTRK